MRRPWLQTYTGRAISFPIEPSMLCLEDIAHALSMQCRYAGHTRAFYSVAEHSVQVARWVHRETGGDKDTARMALFHDAAEAYLTDLPKPVKHLCPGYRNLEAEVGQAVLSWLGLGNASLHWNLIHEADWRILSNEAELLLGPPPQAWNHHPKGPLPGVEIAPMSPTRAYLAFCEEAARLGVCR